MVDFQQMILFLGMMNYWSVDSGRFSNVESNNVENEFFVMSKLHTH